MPDSSLTIEQVLTLLAETPQRIAALTAGLTPAQLHTAPTLVSGPQTMCWPISVRVLTCGATASRR